MTKILACVFLVGFSTKARAQESMKMTGMENTVGFLSSRTSIEPKSTSESAAMVYKTLGKWGLMFHANAFVADTQQSGPRGGDKLFSPNWLMLMLGRTSGSNAFTVRTMLSLEPVTITQRRYPLLFQTGEMAFGKVIVDGQHPHDLVMELAARYDHFFNDRTQLFFYGGLVGEPALGPTAFPHRASASENPTALLSHHNQDSTHISDSVITLGFAGGPIQLEASTFHGQEPDENRWNFDGGKPDSFASRLTVSAGNTIVGQFSMGRINNRERSEEGMDTLRTTASLHHFARFSNGHVATSLIWGRNKDIHQDDRRISNAYALEATVNFGRNWGWTRIENADRDSSLLASETSVPVEETSVGRVQAWTFGYERDLLSTSSPVQLGLGAQATVYGIPGSLKSVYGDHPAGFTVFVRIRPKGNMKLHMQGMHQHQE
jgi:hypothetical protein